jgi:hypothetical protein
VFSHERSTSKCCVEAEASQSDLSLVCESWGDERTAKTICSQLFAPLNVEMRHDSPERWHIVKDAKWHKQLGLAARALRFAVRIRLAGSKVMADKVRAGSL